MVGSGEKRITLCQTVKGERSKGSPAVHLFRKETFGFPKSKGIEIKYQSGPQDSSSGEPSSRRQMAVQHNIYAEYYDKRHQHTGTFLQNDIVFWFKQPVVGLLQALSCVLIPVCRINPQKGKHTAGSYKQDTGLSKCIKGPVIQNHASHHIHCPCLSESFRYIA